MPNIEYIFTYIDPKTGNKVSIKALAIGFFKDCIKVKYINDTQNSVCTHCPNKKANNIIARCSCILNPPDVYKYNGPEIIFIPIENILNINYIVSEKYNGEVRVMLLGISAEVVKAIIIRMAIFDDKVEDAVKNITLEAGKVYDFTYISGNNICSKRSKVVKIEEVEGCIYSRPSSNYVREHVGAHNSVYVNFNDATKEEFMQARPAKKVKIIVDVSSDGSGIYETIMLDCIRDCTIIEDGVIEDDNTNEDVVCNCCSFKHCGCNPSNCGHHDKVPSSAYIDNDELVIK